MLLTCFFYHPICIWWLTKTKRNRRQRKHNRNKRTPRCERFRFISTVSHILFYFLYFSSTSFSSEFFLIAQLHHTCFGTTLHIQLRHLLNLTLLKKLLPWLKSLFHVNVLVLVLSPISSKGMLWRFVHKVICNRFSWLLAISSVLCNYSPHTLLRHVIYLLLTS